MPKIYQITPNNSLTVECGIFGIGHSYAGYCEVSMSSQGGVVFIGGTPLNNLGVVITPHGNNESFVITYDGSAGSTRRIVCLVDKQ